MGGGTGGLLYIPEEISVGGINAPYNWELERDDFVDDLLKYMSQSIRIQGPPVTPMVFKYPNPVVTWTHCCFSGCDPLPCGCCITVRTWCPHSVAPYGRQ